MRPGDGASDRGKRLIGLSFVEMTLVRDVHNMGHAVPLAQIAPARLEDRLGSAGPPSRKFGELGFGGLWQGTFGTSLQIKRDEPAQKRLAQTSRWRGAMKLDPERKKRLAWEGPDVRNWRK